MRSFIKSGVLVGVALLAAALAGVTAAAENPNDDLQGSWNDYPAKWVKSTGMGTGPVHWGPNAGDDAQQPSAETQTYQPEEDEPHGILRPWPIPESPRQQQQGKPSGGFAWGGGKTGGSGYFGGKQGGSFNWGKTKPPQSQQGFYPRQPGGQTPQQPGGQADSQQADLLRYIQVLERQNRELKKLLERLAGSEGNNERDPGLMNDGAYVE